MFARVVVHMIASPIATTVRFGVIVVAIDVCVVTFVPLGVVVALVGGGGGVGGGGIVGGVVRCPVVIAFVGVRVYCCLCCWC